MFNPVLRREITTSFRNMKFYILLMIYVLFLCIVTWISIKFVDIGYYGGGFTPSIMNGVYGVIAFFQFSLILLVTPSLGAGAISGEKERQTLDLLLVTKMSTFDIAFGKFMSSMFKVFLMIIVSMPVYSIVFYYGGISIKHIISLTLYSISVAACFGSISIFLSSVLKRTLSANVMTYVLLILSTLGLLIIMIIISYILNEISYTYNYAEFYNSKGLIGFIVRLNEKLHLMDKSIALYINKFLAVFNPGFGFVSLLDSQFGTDITNYFIYEISDLYGVYNYPKIPIYIYNGIINIIITFIMLLGTSKVLVPVKKSNRFK